MVLVTERRGRGQSGGPSRGTQRSNSKGRYAHIECFHCGKKGHTKKYCRLLKKENRKEGENTPKKENGKGEKAEINTATEEFFVCCDFDTVNFSKDESSWVVDSGATCHVTSSRDFYSSYTSGNYGIVKMGNQGLSKIVGVGDVCLKFDTGVELVLRNVKHVPDMRLNFISVGLLDDDGYFSGLGNGVWKLTRGSLIVSREKKEEKLYVTHSKVTINSVNTIDNNDTTELWHKRFA
ncbi:hypothetical protein OROGR_017754 [Orobanche gracilis]